MHLRKGIYLSINCFKSLAHNPGIMGLCFSVLDQFTNESHFVTGGDFLC